MEQPKGKIEKSQEYTGSPLPFVFFLFIAVVSSIIAMLMVPSPATVLPLLITVISATLKREL